SARRKLCRAGGAFQRAAEHDAYLAAPQPDETQGMSRKMTSVDTTGPEPEGDDIVAAEYVLGVLPADERVAATRRIDADAPFARIVDKWEVYFSPLAVAYQPVEAPAGVKPAVDRRLFAAGAQPTPRAAREAGGMLSSLGFWRGLTAAALAALVLYIT